MIGTKEKEWQTELLSVKQFLTDNKFTRTTPDVLDMVAQLVVTDIHDPTFNIGKAYITLDTRTTNCDSIRMRIANHVKRNFLNVRNSILAKYDYDIGDECFGVRNFIDQIAIVFSIYGQAY